MRTTIRIDDHLFRRVKERAASTGRTIGAIVEDALRQSLSQGEQEPRRSKPLPTYGSSGTMPGVDLDSNHDLLEIMESRDAPT